MAVPNFFESDARREELAWNDWPAVRAFIERERICRIGVNDDIWPYVVAQSYRFDGNAFVMNFSRSGRLAALLARDPHCTIEIDELLRISPDGEPLNADYRSVLARCRAAMREIELPDKRTIIEMHAVIVKLSAKQRLRF